MAVASSDMWVTLGTSYKLYVDSATVKRTAADKCQVTMSVRWAMYWENNSTWNKMDVSCNGKSINLHDGDGASSGKSGTLVTTYTIPENSAINDLEIKVVFKVTYSENSSKTSSKTLSFTIDVPAWTSYTVKYNTNGGSGTFANQTKWKNQSLTLHSATPTLTGYTFQGWALSKALADAGTWYYKAGGTCGKNENLTLYAVWQANKYTITYNKNTTDTVTSLPSAQTKTYGTSLTLTTSKPSRTNYNFLGWAESAGGSVAYQPGATYSKAITSSVTLYAVWELAYTKPSIDKVKLYRAKLDGNDEPSIPDDTSTMVAFSFDYDCDRTPTEISIRWVSDDDNGTDDFLTRFYAGDPSNATLSGNAYEVIRNIDKTPHEFSTDRTYTVIITVRDSVGYTTVSRTLSSLRFPIDVLKQGKGVAFGKAAQTEQQVGFGWNACFDNELRICGVDLQGNVKEAFQPVNENGNTVVGWSNYDMQNGKTNIYGHDVYIGVSNLNGSTALYKPYFRSGDTVTFSSLRTAGYVTNGSADVTFLVPFSCPILGGPTAAAESINGFVIRQDSTYLYGSGPSNDFAIPSQYSTTVSQGVGVYVTAHFSEDAIDSATVSNNDTVGIYWSGKITFE